MDNTQRTVAYIIGNKFDALTQLPNVYSLNQFFTAILEKNLPEHRLWIVGQGIHAAVREILSLCEKFYSGLHFHFGSLALDDDEEWKQYHELIAQNNIQKAEEPALEWKNFQFIDAYRVKADLKLMNLSEDTLLAHDFIFTAARELSEEACRHGVTTAKLLIKTGQLQSFHRFFPLPITVETQFQLIDNNTRSLKSLTRFYQDCSCIAEVNLSFDLYNEAEAKKMLHTLGEKTFNSFSDKMMGEN